MKYFKTFKDFVETFYTCDFTGFVGDISSDKERDFEIALNVEAPRYPVNNSVEAWNYNTNRKTMQENSFINVC